MSHHSSTSSAPSTSILDPDTINIRYAFFNTVRMEAEFQPNFFAGFEAQVTACRETTFLILDRLLTSQKQPFQFSKDRYEDDIKTCRRILVAVLDYLRAGRVAWSNQRYTWAFLSQVVATNFT
jgi:hypothetical protein